MIDDPTARITAALTTYITAKAIYGAALLETRAVMHQANAYMATLAPVCEALEVGWPAVIARLAALEIIARRVTPTFLCEDEVEDIATERSADTDIQCLAGYIRDQDIEIDRSHEREAAQGARLAAAEALIAVVRDILPDADCYDYSRADLITALATYDALAGAGEGTAGGQ